jgi:hypothetical protein
VKPIEAGREQNEAEEGCGEFSATSAEATEALKAGVGIFDSMAMRVELRVEV